MGAAWYGFAANRKFTAEDGPLIARMSAALSRPHMTLRHRRSLYFALGKARDDMGDYEAAMRNFEAGNRLRVQGGGFDCNALALRIDKMIAETPPGFRDRQPDPGIADATP